MYIIMYILRHCKNTLLKKKKSGWKIRVPQCKEKTKPRINYKCLRNFSSKALLPRVPSIPTTIPVQWGCHTLISKSPCKTPLRTSRSHSDFADTPDLLIYEEVLNINLKAKSHPYFFLINI